MNPPLIFGWRVRMLGRETRVIYGRPWPAGNAGRGVVEPRVKPFYSRFAGPSGREPLATVTITTEDRCAEGPDEPGREAGWTLGGGSAQCAPPSPGRNPPIRRPREAGWAGGSNCITGPRVPTQHPDIVTACSRSVGRFSRVLWGGHQSGTTSARKCILCRARRPESERARVGCSGGASGPV
jgi:hypothetical protein